MASDTVTTPEPRPSESAELDRLLDLYWGGAERRITGLTIKIMGVNAIALLILMLGVLYLGQSQNYIIEAKLQTLDTEISLLSAAISAGALDEVSAGENALASHEQAIRQIVRELGSSIRSNIKIVDAQGKLLLDLNKPFIPHQKAALAPEDLNRFFTIQILKDFTAFIISLLPDGRVLPTYPLKEDYESFLNWQPDVIAALDGNIAITAWTDKSNNIILTAAGPLHAKGDIKGAILLSRLATDIESEIVDVWLDIIRIFLGTLLITILISIYFSGTIARPLKRLAGAAENFRKKYGDASDIPDLSARHDEIGELSVVLRNMVKALKDRMDTIEAFAADVAHELKNPLTSLKSAVETALIVKKKEDLDKLLDIIQHDVTRLDRLITDISSASKLDAELSRSIFTPVDTQSLLQNLLDNLKAPLERGRKKTASAITTRHNVTINFTIEHEGPYMVIGSAGRLAQVFQNLLDNAQSFSPEGGNIIMTLSKRLGAVIVTIEDEGPGIPESKLETIFDRFYSERPESEDFGNHSGLGLFICRQIIEAHQGRIFAENKKDDAGQTTGARFTVILNQGKS